ncbi:MAG: GNAT family N-acetyltransferase [Bacteroidota bacterium]|nr:GNAT family N-acetyltransferase [Bacteroidota bacterium]
MGKIESKNHSAKNDISVLIRNAHPDDAETLIDINLKIVDEKLYMLRQPGEATYTKEGEVKNIGNLLNGEGTLYIVAEVENSVVGYLDFRNGGLKITKHAGSLSLYILKEWRGKGIGRLVLKALIEWAEKNSLIEKVTLNVFSTNERAQNLYKKLGFTEEGRCPKDMKLENGTYMDSVLMYKFVK